VTSQHPRAPREGRREARSGVLVLGGGFGGATTARALGRSGATLVSNENALLFTPMIPEVASGSLEPRHVVVPLRQMCPHVDLTIGEVAAIDPEASSVLVRNEVGDLRYHYEHLVIALGAIPRVFPIPGLAEHGVGFKTFQDAVYLRNHVLRELELADNELSEARAAAHLGFVFVGAGYAGVEALAELHDLVRDALRDYPRLRGIHQRWVLVDAQDRILPAIPTRLGDYAAQQLARRGIEIRTSTRLSSVHGDRVELEGGEVITAHTLVWSAGVAPHPLTASFGLPTDEQGRIVVDEYLRVTGTDKFASREARGGAFGAGTIWAIGDIARVPNASTPERPDPPTSQHAIRQGRLLARNLRAARAGQPLRPYRYRALGQVATLGRYRGIAEVLNMHFSGFLGWLITRSYHLYALPLLRRRIRVAADWALALFFRRDTVSYGRMEAAPSLGSQDPPPGVSA
jgi:NADH dehydrogenase